MHEFALAQDIFSSLRQSLGEDFHRINRINIEVGSFSGIVPESLTFGLQTIFKSENITGSLEVNITDRETTAICECGYEYRIKNIFDLCPKCHSHVREVKDGTDIYVSSVEIGEEN